MKTDLHFLTVAEAADLLRSRRLSPVELITGFLRRIDSVEGKINSYITLDAERALAAAAEAEREIAAGRYLGPLHGIPYGLKDTIHAAGWPTTANSRLTFDFNPGADSTVHRKLNRAGAILLGKLNTYEFGTGTGADLPELAFPPSRNPWNTNCFTGGSSTGSGASVAAGTAMFALGVDTGGSVRLPAAGCGLIGLKPTYGRVSRAGVLPNTYTLDHVGPLTWTATDAAMVLQAIAGHDAIDPASLPAPVAPSNLDDPQIRGLRIGVLRRFHEGDIAADPEIIAAIDQAVGVLQGLGAIAIEVNVADTQQNYLDCMRAVNVAECFSIHEKDFRERRDDMGPALFDKLMSGAILPSSIYLRAQRWRRQLSSRLNALFEACDVIVCGATSRPAPDLTDGEAVADFTSESAMAPFSLSGHPALSLCVGFSRTGLPLSMQIAGRHLQEATILAVAAAYERATSWREHRPTCGARPLESRQPAGRASTSASDPPDVGADLGSLAAHFAIKIRTPRDRDSLTRQVARTEAMIGRFPPDLPSEVEPAASCDTIDVAG